MSRTALRHQLAALDLSGSPDEERDRGRMLELLDSTPDCFHRTCFPGHFTGSAVVLSADRTQVLLHHHRKLDRWLQFGGHCDGDEDVARVAMREAWEESGVEGLLLVSPTPLDLDIHEIPARKEEPTHLHYDVRYLAIAPAAAQFVRSEESHDLAWFSPAELEKFPLDPGLRRLIAKAFAFPA